MTPQMIRDRYDRFAQVLLSRGETVPPLPVGDPILAETLVHELAARVTGRSPLRIRRGSPVHFRDVTQERESTRAALRRVKEHPLADPPPPYRPRHG